MPSTQQAVGRRSRLERRPDDLFTLGFLARGAVNRDSAAREPFYRESADILLRARGIEFTRHCESCHTPVALFSGALRKDAPRQQAPFTALDHEGVTCSVCHSVTDAKLNGTGSFTVRRPALIAKEDGAPVFGEFTDEQILADIPGHKRAVMRPLLRSPEFCATCDSED